MATDRYDKEQTMKKRLILILFALMFVFSMTGCGKLQAPTVTINQSTFSGGDEIDLSWDEVKNADCYEVCFYISPFSDAKLARSIQLTDTTWQGSMQAGQYDIVVYAIRNGKQSDAAQTISITVESVSVPSWDDINYIFSCTYNQLQSKYGKAAVETDTGSSVIRSYESPVMDLTYPDNAGGECTQIDIYDSNYILFGTRIGVNTQSELIAGLNANKISYQTNSEAASAGFSLSTVFSYNDYTITFYNDSSYLISYVSISNR